MIWLLVKKPTKKGGRNINGVEMIGGPGHNPLHKKKLKKLIGKNSYIAIILSMKFVTFDVVVQYILYIFKHPFCLNLVFTLVITMQNFKFIAPASICLNTQKETFAQYSLNILIRGNYNCLQVILS